MQPKMTHDILLLTGTENYVNQVTTVNQPVNRKHVFLVNFRVDRTLTGHILGSPSRRLKYPVPERGLSRVSVSLLRFVTHACMLKATCEDSAVSSLTFYVAR